MENETVVISNYQKLVIFVNWSLKLGGFVLIYHCLALHYNWHTPLKSVELNEVWAKQEDLAYGVMAAQEDILELHKKVKK